MPEPPFFTAFAASSVASSNLVTPIEKERVSRSFFLLIIPVCLTKIMKIEFDDYLKDAELHIETTGRIETFSDPHIFPYEATSYSVLDRLVESGFITASDCLLDYGCGKGRVPVYVSHRLGCRSVGVEYVNAFYKDALCNITSYKKYHPGSGLQVRIEQASASMYDPPADVNRIFFFNPFSPEIFSAAMQHILRSYYTAPRQILLFFYYPQDAYVAHLSTLDAVSFYDEIDCMDLFAARDDRNRILIFEIP